MFLKGESKQEGCGGLKREWGINATYLRYIALGSVRWPCRD